MPPLSPLRARRPLRPIRNLRNIRSIAALLCLLPFASCGSSNGPIFTITSPGTGPVNTLPLLPNQVGYIGFLLDRTENAIVDSVSDSPAGPVFRAVGIDDAYVQRYLKTPDGIFAAGDSTSTTSAGILRPRCLHDEYQPRSESRRRCGNP